MLMVFAQTPTHYPTGGDPVEFTAINVLVYIVFPALLFVGYLLIRQRQKKKDRSEHTSGK
jgi:hypothetical protein